MRRRMTVLSWAAACAVVMACACAFAQEPQPEVRRDVPYVPTPQEVVDEMLKMANVGKNDVVYDLGCGDGRLVVTAVKKFGAKRGVGVDIDPQRIRESDENARAAGVADRTKFVVQDLFKTDISEATVVTLYLLPDVNLRLRPKLLSDLKPGTRIVSHAFDMGDWQPEKTASVDGRMIYFWTVPATKPPAARPSDDLRLRPSER
jgi:SAM-dependent methyltransferase